MSSSFSRPKQGAEVHRRPAERVMEYLLAEFDRPDLKNGSRLPTIRQVTTRLKVSMPTVQGVFSRLAGEGRIRTEIGNGTFLVSKHSNARGEIRIVLSISPPPDTSVGARWGRQIYGAILEAASQSRRKIRLMPLSPQAGGDDAAHQELLTERSEVDGLIAFPATINDAIRDAYEKDGKPVVELNPSTDEACANFVSAGYFSASLQLGKAWRQTGRKRVLLIVNWPLEESVSSRLRLAGLVNGLGCEVGASMICRTLVASHQQWAQQGEQQTMSALRALLADPTQSPDAIYCASDMTAVAVVSALQLWGLNIPHDISVVGGSGIDLGDTPCPGLTRTRQPFEEMGAELLAMICHRIEHDGDPLPARILPMSFMGGATTRPEENALLCIGNQ